MSYPSNSHAILTWLGYELDADYTLFSSGLRWLNTDPGDAYYPSGPTEADILAAGLPATKAIAITANRAECRRRILAVWPVEEQCSANAGVYPQAEHDAMKAWIAAHIEAENAAADLITAATTAAEVEAVTVSWPGV